MPFSILKILSPLGIYFLFTNWGWEVEKTSLVISSLQMRTLKLCEAEVK